MCGIVGYIGQNQAAPILLSGLKKLEYRGYDSAGVAVYESGKIRTEKSAGRLAILEALLEGGKKLPGTVGIGHTRWATHGGPSDVNAHPHSNSDGSIVVVHNGIIENYGKLKKRLQAKGYRFQSETDTEVIVHLLDSCYRGEPLAAITEVMDRLEGSYALGILFRDHPEELYAVRKDSPLVVGIAKEGNLIASDVPAVLPYTKDVCFLENEEIAKLTQNQVLFYHPEEGAFRKKPVVIDWDPEAAEKGGYTHFMRKELLEQPGAVRETLASHLTADGVVLPEVGLSEAELRGIRKLCIVACGSAYHAGVTGKYVVEGMARVPVEVDLASEYRYRNPILEEGTLVVIISQSGETADSLAALREAKKRGAKVLGIVNVVGSSISREADTVIYTMAGPEIAVATTKAYSTQLIVLYLLAMKLAAVRACISGEEIAGMIQALRELPEQMESVLKKEERVQRLAERYLAAKDIFYMGRGIDHAVSMEASLKLKEISYIHSEAYAAGELKHGTISLIEEGTPMNVVMTQRALFIKTLSNVIEVRSRGAFVVAVTTEGNLEAEKAADEVIYIPETNDYFVGTLAILPLQLLAYYVAVGRGCDVDKPRNLAKSVTVE